MEQGLYFSPDKGGTWYLTKSKIYTYYCDNITLLDGDDENKHLKLKGKKK